MSTVTLNVEIKLKPILKALLADKHMTLRDLAKATGIKPSTLSGWKNGSSPRDLSELKLCAQYFNVSMDYLLFGEQNDQSSLEKLLTEQVFDGFLKVRIERVISKKSAR